MLRFGKTAGIRPYDAAEQARAGRLVLVDVREPAERRELAPGVPSRHIPLGQLANRIGELPGEVPVAFVCRSGGRSARATRIAAAAGLDARNVTGGMTAWSEARLPVVRGRTRL